MAWPSSVALRAGAYGIFHGGNHPLAQPWPMSAAGFLGGFEPATVETQTEPNGRGVGKAMWPPKGSLAGAVPVAVKASPRNVDLLALGRPGRRYLRPAFRVRRPLSAGFPNKSGAMLTHM